MNIALHFWGRQTPWDDNRLRLSAISRGLYSSPANVLRFGNCLFLIDDPIQYEGIQEKFDIEMGNIMISVKYLRTAIFGVRTTIQHVSVFGLPHFDVGDIKTLAFH